MNKSNSKAHIGLFLSSNKQFAFTNVIFRSQKVLNTWWVSNCLLYFDGNFWFSHTVYGTGDTQRGIILFYSRFQGLISLFDRNHTYKAKKSRKTINNKENNTEAWIVFLCLKSYKNACLFLWRCLLGTSQQSVAA